MNYPKIAFTDAIRKLQEKFGSRRSYEKMERYSSSVGITTREAAMIHDRDSFYVASIGENGYPYIQHRGGPKGFLKVLKPDLIGFLDFSGNKQYITTGNIETNNRVSLILMDYPRRSRLKIYAEAEVVELGTNESLEQQLGLKDYKYTAERIILYHVTAFDWNCPQHITPRYTNAEIEEAFAGQQAYIESLEKEIETLRKS